MIRTIMTNLDKILPKKKFELSYTNFLLDIDKLNEEYKSKDYKN